MKSIAVYCSSSNKVDDIYKEEAKKVGNLLAKKGIRLSFSAFLTLIVTPCLLILPSHIRSYFKKAQPETVNA